MNIMASVHYNKLRCHQQIVRQPQPHRQVGRSATINISCSIWRIFHHHYDVLNTLAACCIAMTLNRDQELAYSRSLNMLTLCMTDITSY